MNEFETKMLLKGCGIDVPRGKIIKSLEDAKGIDYPAVLKVCSARILHKSDVGGVLFVRNEEELKKAFAELSSKFPNESLLLEEMIEEKGIETIVGIGWDRDFGRFIMAGIGGVLAELYGDVSFRLLPINRKDAIDLVESLKGKKLFHGFRGIKVANEAFYDLLLNVADTAEKKDIKDMDLNPVLLTEERAIVLDAKIVEVKNEAD
ncbi:MAG: acetate--CoA ligase family protein [Candidatus Thermoplasmatota archaeon]|nr:acetate--CoA ligase family protein [Candidatus Thermoplasmatota archaeon]